MSIITVYHVQKGRLVRMPDPGAFGRGDCYLVDAGMKIYLWIGPKSTVDEKFLTAASAVMSDTAREGRADIDRIEGGNEPDDFKALFDDFQLTDEDTAGILKKVHLETHEYKLWRVHREEDDRARRPTCGLHPIRRGHSGGGHARNSPC